MKQKFNVTGMTCSACSAHVEKSVSKVEGVSQVTVNLLTNSMQVEYDESITHGEDIIKAVEDAGYGASDAKGKEQTKKSADTSYQDSVTANIAGMKSRLIISIVFLVPLMYVAMGHMLYMPDFMMAWFHGEENAVIFAFTQFLLLIPIVIVNRKYYITGFKTLAKGSPNMDSLIAIGSGAAILYGIFAIYRIGYGLGHGNMELVNRYSHDLYFESAGTILTLITVGKYLETKSKGKTSEAITKLMNLAPKKATVIREGKEVQIDVGDMAVGDVFLIKPGEAVAVDGVIIEGKSSFDESAITGESMPVSKQEGERVVSAAINKSGLIKAKAVKVGEDTTIAQIIRLVEEASQSKAPIARLADKISGIFVPTVIAIAVITGIVWLITGAGFEFAMSNAIAVLVISCPCALGLATPVAIMVGTGKGAETGILIKSGEALETAHLVDTIVLDKTGTITEGKPQVTDICVYHGISEKELLYIAGSMERGSEHPLSEAVVGKCRQEGIELTECKDFEALFGRGITGTIENTRYYAGNEMLMTELKITVEESIKIQIEQYATQGKTPLIFADSSRILGIIAVADVVKKTSKEAVAQLKSMGMNVVMLTGDNAITANAIKAQVGIDEVIAGVLPDEKEKNVSAIKSAGHKVAMVGDGINDAPALAAADVGIAIGAGTDVAIESADIVLMKSDLMDVGRAIQLSRAVIRNIKQNLFWAFFYNSVGIPLAAGLLYVPFGLKLNPMFGAAAMSLSSVCVVGNALRLKRIKLAERKEMKSMTKTIMIEGMACGHCSARVEKVLSEIAGVKEVAVSLEEKKATVVCEDSVSAEVLKAAVVDAGYEVTEIK